jgi:hypothetical protein
MSKNPLQSWRAPKPKDKAEDLKELDLGVGTRKLVYGRGVAPRIEVVAEQLPIPLVGHKGDLLTAMKLSDHKGEETRFVTVGKDRRILVWNLHGKLIAPPQRHSGQICGVWELSDSRLISWGKDQRLVVWSTQSHQRITRISTRVCSAADVVFTPSGGFCVLSESFWRTRVVPLPSGKPDLPLKKAPSIGLNGQAEAVTDAWDLQAGTWFVTKAAAGLRLWNAQGALAYAFAEPFSLDDGYLVLKDGQLLIIDDKHHQHLFAASGARVGFRGEDEALAGALRKYTKSRKSADGALGALGAGGDFSRLGYRLSPLTESSSAPPGKTDDEISGFFFRPRDEQARAWLNDDVAAASTAGKQVDLARDTLRRDVARARELAAYALALLLVSLACALIASGKPLLLGSLSIALLSVAYIFWQRTQLKVLRAGRTLMTALQRELNQLVSEVQAGRTTLRATFPGVRVYSGEQVLRHIAKTVVDDLAASARKECGLDASQLISDGPFILRDWTLLKHDTAPEMPSNLASFWWTDSALVLAVETIQYVMLTRERVYVYEVDYDFIERRVLGDSVRVLRYGDISYMVERELPRPVSFDGTATKITATQLTLVSNSGESLALCALHHEGAIELRNAAETKENARATELRRNLQTQLGMSPASTRVTVQAELDALQSQPLLTQSEERSRTHTKAQIRNIKRLILERSDKNRKSG